MLLVIKNKYTYDEKEKLGKKYLTEYQKYKNADRSFSL